MDKTKLRKRIKSFATNVGFATAMFTLALFYLPLTIVGQAHWGWVIWDVIFCGVDTFFATRDWKEIKTLLEESE